MLCCYTVDLKTVEPGHLPDAIAAIVGTPEVDASVDCVGFEARGCGHKTCNEVPAQVLNDCMQVTSAGGGIGIPGLYVTEDPGAVGLGVCCC
jgi:glutathione-independent formaldehyde dehydrogenase